MYTKLKLVPVEITKEEAQNLIFDAKYFAQTNLPAEVVAYKTDGHMLWRLFSIYQLPPGIENFSEDQLLEFARNNIPENVNFHN